jgi:hypothetical protein
MNYFVLLCSDLLLRYRFICSHLPDSSQAIVSWHLFLGQHMVMAICFLSHSCLLSERMLVGNREHHLLNSWLRGQESVPNNLPVPG